MVRGALGPKSGLFRGLLDSAQDSSDFPEFWSYRAWLFQAASCRKLMKKPLVFYGALNGDPTILGIQNRGFLFQVLTLKPT